MNERIHDNFGIKISRFIDPTTLAKSTKMIPLNPLFVKGSWNSSFPTQRSETSQFKTRRSRYADCRLMNQKFSLYYFENKDTQIIALPIEGLNSPISFIVFQAFHASVLSIDVGGIFATADSIVTFDLKDFREPIEHSNVINREENISHERIFL
jgi:hypothetical protein